MPIGNGMACGPSPGLEEEFKKKKKSPTFLSALTPRKGNGRDRRAKPPGRKSQDIEARSARLPGLNQFYSTGRGKKSAVLTEAPKTDMLILG